MKRTVCASAALALALVGGACREPAPRPPAPAVETPRTLAWQPSELDLGVTVAGALLRQDVLLRNVTGRSVRLVRLESACECTAAELALPHVLASGDALTVPLTLDLRVLTLGGGPRPGEPGPRLLAREMVAITDEGARAALPLRVVVSDRVRVEPAVVEWKAATVGQPLVAE